MHLSKYLKISLVLFLIDTFTQLYVAVLVGVFYGLGHKSIYITYAILFHLILFVNFLVSFCHAWIKGDLLRQIPGGKA